MRALGGIAALGLVGGLVAFPWLVEGSFPRHTLITLLMYAALAQAWNVLGGYAGQLSFGHAAFFGIGAYTSAVLLRDLGLTPWLGMWVGGLLATGVGLLVGYPCFTLKRHYFALATLALGEIARIAFTHWKFVGGSLGIDLPLRYLNQGVYMMWTDKLPYYYVALGLAALATAVVLVVDRARLGLYLKAINQDEEAAANLGIDVRKYKLVAMGLSAFLTGVVGAFYAQYVLYIDPKNTLILPISVKIVVIALVGGRGTVLGPLLGAALLVPLSEYARTYLGGLGRGYDYLLYGLVVMLLAMREPRGLVALLARLGERAAAKPAPQRPRPAVADVTTKTTKAGAEATPRGEGRHGAA